ncbi:MAG: hypothetical protein WA705_03440 [Candidatus Ozemobacteraceae bacterium]
MKKIFTLVVLFSLFLAPTWAITADQLVKHFEDSQKWVNSAMVSFDVSKKASDQRIADLYDFVSDKNYSYQGFVINGAAYAAGKAGPMADLLKTTGDGVLAVLHKLTTDDHKTLFKPTWIAFHTPGDKRVSNWFCLIMGNHIKTYLTRVDQRSKLDEVGTDPLVMNVLDKNLFNFELVKESAGRAILRITPKSKANTNLDEAIVELALLKIGSAETWYATKIQAKQSTGASGITEYGEFKVAIAPVGTPIVYSNDKTLQSQVPVMGIATALNQKVDGDQKLYVFATTIHNTSYQTEKGAKEYSVDLRTTITNLYINPAVETMAKLIEPARLKTLEKLSSKVVRSH